MYRHQRAFLERLPKCAILSHEAGTGKSRIACEWLKAHRNQRALIICTKTIKDKWRQELNKWGVHNPCLILSKEEFKKIPIMKLNDIECLIVDEAQHFSSPLFITTLRSQASEHLYAFIQSNPSIPRLLLSGNVVRSTPWNIHTLIAMCGNYIDYREYQRKYFRLITRPYLPRPAWEPVPGWQAMMQPLINQYCDVAIMKDCADVPVHEYQSITVPLTPENQQSWDTVEEEELEPMSVFVKRHRLEAGIEKLEWLKAYGEEVKKCVVVCHYTSQIEEYAKELRKQKQVFVLTGKTENRGELIAAAQAAPECWFIVQNAVAEGYDLDSFAHMVFASKNYRYIDHAQIEARINRIHNLHHNQYITLISGECDAIIIKAIQAGKDFDPSIYLSKQKHATTS